ncbi:enoyl-CoA hydratase/isomerase family protein [Acidipropionibacterium acidipropionici]|uniref:enoyl-CoA hydratase/isomerase family protein n=1 Tax=Acidipropionibacterium acidipropionici TaxID=1748 RepID=UPI000B0F67EB
MQDQPEQNSDLEIVRSGEELQIRLQRPRAINSLTGAMLGDIGRAVPGSTRLDISGAGEKGFCSGADIRELRSLALSDVEAATGWLETEYDVDLAIARLGHGVAHLHGVSMGGGLGLTLRLERVEAARDLVLAMPETGIGLWPDVGACWELSRAPRLAGRHLAMTGMSIDAASALWAGLVDVVVDEEGSPLDVDPLESELAADAGWIQECYRFNDPVSILEALASRPEPEARAAADLISTRSPLSVAVALEAVQRAEQASGVEEVLATDRVLGRSFMRASDFCEGVRAQLVDKDHDPRWSHASVADVSRAEVEAMFDAQ